MNIAVKIIGILFVLIGIVYLLKPDTLKHLIGFLKKGKRIYFVGVIRIILAVIFLLAANQCKKAWIVIVFGILFMLSAVLVFMLSSEKLKAITAWYEKQSFLVLRVFALIAVVAGTIIIYSA